MIKKRILLVGSNGMLGQRLINYYLSKLYVELLCCSVEENSYISEAEYRTIDITSKNSVQKTIKDFYPDVIINAAGFTNVDGCETDKESAWKVNVTGVEFLAKYAIISDAHIIHFSTDYIFDGVSGPYEETDLPNPICYYGRTKLASENILQSSSSKSTIIRTNVLYGPAKYGRPDFVKWIVDSLTVNKEISIVDDQINNPTYIDDLVSGINKIIEFNKLGIFNIGGLELLSRYDFTVRIAEYFNLSTSLIKRIKTEELKQIAPRPLNSGLINLKAESEISYKPLKIEETLRLMKKEIFQ